MKQKTKPEARSQKPEWCRKTVFILASGFWLLASSLSAQTTYTLEQVFAKMDQVAKGFRSTQADIERTKVTLIVNDKDVAHGKIYYVRRGKEPRLKIQLSEPMAQYLLIDKGKLQLYTPNLKQVQEASLGGHSNTVEQFMALGFGQSSEDLKKNYQVSLAGEETVDGKKTAVLELMPKNAGMGIKNVRMWMDEQTGISVQVKATETSGDYTMFRYTNIKLNGNIADTTFDLKMPKDVRVLKM